MKTRVKIGLMRIVFSVLYYLELIYICLISLFTFGLDMLLMIKILLDRKEKELQEKYGINS